MANLIDITGNDYNFLHVLGLSHMQNGQSYWYCQCKRCGRIVVVRKNNFAYEWSRQMSCGCLHDELSSAKMKALHEKRRKEHDR